ncbi:hypothetical protein QO002_002173 [Pararhizobium capsulatum DSM 1112]|uniref:Uncharacterized protein n=1 Tax=Pararhizobium capsulatum DSM 1112 TaxID=1121113 RepID=A0ABU0BP62_9HYPH|nr:hypothetical protein [Pararhizobium capsulatum DSM 1112]
MTPRNMIFLLCGAFCLLALLLIYNGFYKAGTESASAKGAMISDASHSTQQWAASSGHYILA